MLPVIYTPVHKKHDPPFEFSRDGVYPYSESPLRAQRLRAALSKAGICQFYPPRPYGLEALETIHTTDYLNFLQEIYPAWIEAGFPSTGVIPDTFAVRDMAACPPNRLRQPGYYGFDAQTPIVEGTWAAAQAAAACALTGADMLLAGHQAAYALCRPPGHHAGPRLYGGYSYLNNAALAAAHLPGPVAIIDIDFHHGNGTQAVFYNSDQVLFVSLHADPQRAYPFYSGYAKEKGTGAGTGYNHNLPLPAGTDDQAYGDALGKALDIIAGFAPKYLVVSVGLDIFRDDPLGDFDLSLEAFGTIGQKIAALTCPTLLVQEGGYNTDQGGQALVNLLTPFLSQDLVDTSQ